MAARAPWGRPFVQEQNLAAFHSLYVQVQALTRSTLYSPRGTSCQTGLLNLSGQLIDHFGWRGREWLSEVGKKRLLQCSRLWRRTPDQDRDQGAGAEGTKSESKGPALD